MTLSAAQITRILGAIETDSLVFLCGAGLSIPSPSDLPSAVRVSQMCFDARRPVEPLDPSLRDDVNRLAGLFHARGDFATFIRLVPWNELVGTPNNGHAAIADLLVSRGAHAALSSNFDPMIESWAHERKIALRGALTGQEAVNFMSVSNPLVKFHGCFHRAPDETLWTDAQLNDPVIHTRIQSCSQWMNLHLPAKHLVVVGFWTDWGYLNDMLANAFAINNAASVLVVNPSSSSELQTKAPNLWTKLTSLSHTFEHVEASATDVLEEIRTAYSATWARKFYELGEPLVAAIGATFPSSAVPDDMSGEELYNLRRDAEAVPYNRMATRRSPSETAAQAALAHLVLLNAGANKKGSWLEYGGKSVRVINGAGRALADVRSRYKEPVALPQADMVVCAGAVDLGVPAAVIPSGRGKSVIRPESGGVSIWLTLETARAELGL